MMAKGSTYGIPRLNQYLLHYVNELCWKQHFLSPNFRARLSSLLHFLFAPKWLWSSRASRKVAAVPAHCCSSLCLCPFSSVPNSPLSLSLSLDYLTFWSALMIFVVSNYTQISYHFSSLFIHILMVGSKVNQKKHLFAICTYRLQQARGGLLAFNNYTSV